MTISRPRNSLCQWPLFGMIRGAIVVDFINVLVKKKKKNCEPNKCDN